MLLPVRTMVLAWLVSAKTNTFPLLLKVSVPLPEASIVARCAVAPTVKPRSVVPLLLPRYCSVPPSMTKFPALLVEAPRPLGCPPAARVVTASTPPLMRRAAV